MARRVPLPESKLKRRKRVMRTRLAIAGAVGLFVLAGAVVGLSWVPYIRIHAIEVTGAETLSTSIIEDFASAKLAGRNLFVFPRNSIFAYPKKEISSGLLAEYPQLSAVNVRAENFETIGIELTERHPAALWCESGGSCRLMDETGFVYAPDLLLDAPAFVRYAGEATTTRSYTAKVEPLQYLTPQEFKSLAALVAALDANQTDATIDEADVDQNGDVHAHFSNGFTLIFALKDASGDVFERFTLALASQPFLNKSLSDFEYLDLRFGDKLYYREKAK